MCVYSLTLIDKQLLTLSQPESHKSQHFHTNSRSEAATGCSSPSKRNVGECVGNKSIEAISNCKLLFPGLPTSPPILSFQGGNVFFGPPTSDVLTFFLIRNSFFSPASIHYFVRFIDLPSYKSTEKLQSRECIMRLSSFLVAALTVKWTDCMAGDPFLQPVSAWHHHQMTFQLKWWGVRMYFI